MRTSRAIYLELSLARESDIIPCVGQRFSGRRVVESFTVNKGEGFRYALSRGHWDEETAARLREAKYSVWLILEHIWLSLVDPNWMKGTGAKIRVASGY